MHGFSYKYSILLCQLHQPSTANKFKKHPVLKLAIAYPDMAALYLFAVVAVIISSFNNLPVARSADPDILSDFLLPPNATSVDGTFFTFTGFRTGTSTGEVPNTFTVFKASASEFPALIGQSVSYAVLLFPPGSVNPPHTHPRSAELLFLIGGSLEVGFVDTANNLYNQTLQTGDMFVFPKGLVHFQSCIGNNTALAISAFGSASAGTVSLPKTLFGSGIAEDVLAKSFKTDAATVQSIEVGLAKKP